MAPISTFFLSVDISSFMITRKEKKRWLIALMHALLLLLFFWGSYHHLPKPRQRNASCQNESLNSSVVSSLRREIDELQLQLQSRLTKNDKQFMMKMSWANSLLRQMKTTTMTTTMLTFPLVVKGPRIIWQTEILMTKVKSRRTMTQGEGANIHLCRHVSDGVEENVPIARLNALS